MNAQWITVRLGDDYNWWLESTGNDERHPAANCGVLDPRQVRHLREAFERYSATGLRYQDLLAAFRPYTMESEIDEGQLRLAACNEDLFEGGEVFVLPVLRRDDDSPYDNFLDALATAHIKYLNATHRYAHPCTTDEMYDEIQVRDADRFFGADSRHCFDEINEILEWNPAEWDDASAS